MENAPYTRRTSARDTARRYARRGRYGRPPAKTGFRDKLLTQAVVSGLCLAAVLFVCQMDTSLTGSLKNSLRQSLSESADHIVADIRSWSESLMADDRAGEPEQATAGTDDFDSRVFSERTGQETAEDMQDSRIDEDMLAEMNGSLKSIAPAPSAKPEP